MDYGYLIAAIAFVLMGLVFAKNYFKMSALEKKLDESAARESKLQSSIDKLIKDPEGACKCLAGKTSDERKACLKKFMSQE